MTQEHGDSIGALLRLVDMPETSPETTARHKALARAHWQRRLRARTRRRWTYRLAAAAVLCLAFGLWQMASLRNVSPAPSAEATTAAQPDAIEPVAAKPVARLSMLAGPVHRDDGDGRAPATLDAGADVSVGAVLETGTDSRAAFQLASGHELRLDVDTRLRLVSNRLLALERGALYVDSHGSPGSLEIHTALGTARDIGTRFEVRLDDDALRVRVRDGMVEVDHAGDTHQAHSGAELTVDADGTLARRTIEVYGPEWRWSLEVAPAFDIEGRTLSEFLAWVTREAGWRLRVDPAIADGATAVTLNGSITGLAPDEALDVVLPTTGLKYHLADGELVIEPLI